MDDMHHLSKKSNYEIEMPELVICYKENSYLRIKDICVDEKMGSRERMLFENDLAKEDLRTLLLLERGRSKGTTTEITEFSDPTPDYLKFSEELVCESPHSQAYSEEIRKTEVKVHEVTEYTSICQMLSKAEESAKEIPQEKPSSELVCSGHAEMPPKELEMESISSNPASIPDHGESVSIPYAGESNNNTVKHPEGEIPRSPSEESNHTNSVGRSSNEHGQVDSSGNGNQDDHVPDQIISKVHGSWEDSFRDHDIIGETSFSMAGPISGLITHSGRIAFSGNISLRSDSTTSTRSFAFPILQSEWHSSPVRMAKANKRGFRKHGGWRQGLLCCRF
ncbi:hypothetical protein SAY86_019187 [Trapa natans]|uniref:Uncharacterized protein n=1 Tax=Trapa natans TaxID=22666 RepID=A0AAN7QYQ7_TRANT|nr:hypothetical protein SAY86_019187 [Trapa natans]